MTEDAADGRHSIAGAVFRNPWVRFVGLLILVYIGLRVLYVIRGILVPFSLALVTAYIFDPVVDWLEGILANAFRRRGGGTWSPRVRRGVAVGVLVALFAVVLGLFLFVAVPSAVIAARDKIEKQEFSDVKEFLPDKWQEGIEAWLESAPKERRLIASRLLADLFAEKSAADAVGQSLRAIVVSTFSAIMWVFQFFLFFVVTIYLLLDIDHIRLAVQSALPRRHKDEISRVAGRIDVNLKAFFRGQVVVVAVLSCIFTAGLGLVGCPFWYIVGITAGIGAFVPYFALASGMVPAVVLSAAEYNDLWHPIAAAAVFAFGMAMDNIVVTPHVIGKRVGMHPVTIIFSILVFGTLFGFLGVIFAVPIAAVVKVVAQELFERYKASGLYAG